LLGFTPADTPQQRALEAEFDTTLSPRDLESWMKQLAAGPHHVGSAYDKENADFIAGLFKSWGFDTTIESFGVLFPTPTARVLEMIAPEKYTAKLAEPAMKEDAASGQKDQLPVYNAYSADGDVTAELVYVNYGVPRDYEVLAEHGINVQGKIV